MSSNDSIAAMGYLLRLGIKKIYVLGGMSAAILVEGVARTFTWGGICYRHESLDGQISASSASSSSVVAKQSAKAYIACSACKHSMKNEFTNHQILLSHMGSGGRLVWRRPLGRFIVRSRAGKRLVVAHRLKHAFLVRKVHGRLRLLNSCTHLRLERLPVAVRLRRQYTSQIRLVVSAFVTHVPSVSVHVLELDLCKCVGVRSPRTKGFAHLLSSLSPFIQQRVDVADQTLVADWLPVSRPEIVSSPPWEPCCHA